MTLDSATHEAEQGAAAGRVPLVDGGPEVGEVEVLEAAEAGRQQGTAHQDEEGGEELLRGQGLAAPLLLLVDQSEQSINIINQSEQSIYLLRIARPRQPEPAQSLQIT